MIDYKDIPLKTTEDFCLYSNGNYIACFQTIEEALEYIRKESVCTQNPKTHISFMNYTILKSITV